MCIGYRLGPLESPALISSLLTGRIVPAIFEYKITLAALAKQFSFAETGATIETRVAISLQPYVAGQREAGHQLPLRVQPIDG